VRAEFVRADVPAEVVGSATWLGNGVAIEDGGEVGEALDRIFRPSPVVIDDPSLRSFGTAGPAVLQPGSLQWFRAAAQARAPAEGLAVRFVPDGAASIGWDPAGAYRTFPAAAERRELLGPAEAGERSGPDAALS